jgi:hypothetical protein
VSDVPSTVETLGNREKKKKIPCTLPTKTKRYSGSIIRFIGGCSVIGFGVIVIVGVTGDRTGEMFLVSHEEGSD